MKICAKCSAQFPKSMTINGKCQSLNGRKYCFTCSPLGSRNSIKLETKPDFFPDPARLVPTRNVELQCSYCSKTFIRKKFEVNESGKYFCSRKCAAHITGVGRVTNPAKDRVCKRCGIIYKRGGSHRTLVACQNCTILNKQGVKRPPSKAKKTASPRKKLPPGTVHERRTALSKARTLGEYHAMLSVAGKHDSWKNAHIRGFARSWNPDICNHPCQSCGYSKHVELAHVKPLRDFGPTDTLGDINSSSNLLALCRNCHWEFDNDLLLLADIPERSEINISK